MFFVQIDKHDNNHKILTKFGLINTFKLGKMKYNITY